ncbi:MAG: HD-GYP domain-containing protein [Pirellulales bacterium]
MNQTDLLIAESPDVTPWRGTDGMPSPELSVADLPAESLLRPRERTTSGKVMIVDDEPIIIAVVQKYLKQSGYGNFITTTEPREALDMIRGQKPDVIVMDVMMPHVSGLNILEVIRGDRNLHHLPVVMMTASGHDGMKQEAIDLGATDFLTKPIKSTELVPRIRNALVVKAHHDQLAAYSTRLEQEVHLRTAELDRSRQEIIQVLAAAAEYRDQETGNHVLRVGRYAGIIARQLNFSPARVELISQAAILHDVGKIGITDTILHKPGKLTDDEMAVIKQHCRYGQKILQCMPSDERPSIRPAVSPQSQSPILRMAAVIAISHHEKWDGTGYPHGLAGEAIPIEGRITAVADVYDALSSRRPYKEPLPPQRCLEMMQKGRGTHFDPQVLDAFVARFADIVKVSTELTDG